MTLLKIFIFTVKTNIRDLEKHKELLLQSILSLSMDIPPILQDVVDLREMAYGK